MGKKQVWKPGTMVYPLPAVLVGCGSNPDDYNLLTVAWVGTICTNPPMCYISVRPERHSYELIKRNMEFTINPDVLCTLADERFIHLETGAFDLRAAGLIAYSHGNYYELGEHIGKFGWSVQKKQK